jgi:hypothetical protein
MRPTFKKLLLAAASLTMAALAAPAIAGAPAGASTVACLNGSTTAGPTAPTFAAPTQTSSSSSGHGKNSVTTKSTYVTGPGTFKTSFVLQAPSCPGATYSLFVTSADFNSLHWTTDTANTSANPTTTTYTSGFQVAVSFTGDASTDTYSVFGATGDSTGYYPDLCLNSHVEISIAGQVQTVSSSVTSCASTSGSGGGSYF